jgi:diguanylate cyclase (GGDEF)-like protein
MAIVSPAGLTQPRGRSPRGTFLLATGLVAFAVFVLAVYVWGKVALPALPVSSTVHAVAMAVISATIAALLLTHARASGERGYLVLGGTFAYVCGVMVIFPTVYPNGLVVTDPPSVLWGTLQSSATLFHPWHLALIVGVTVSAVVLGHDQRSGRHPGLGRGLSWTALAVAAGLVLTAIVVVGLVEHLPPVVEGVTATPFAVGLFRFEALLALIGTIMVAYECRDGSMISRWLLAVMVVTLGEAVTMLNADRYSVAWYYNRVIGLLAALILLAVLIRDLSRVERATKSLVDIDALTGAASRAAVLAELDRESRRAHRVGGSVCVVCVDIDGFKEINERVGHHVGDLILTETVARITHQAGARNMVGRLGGDEFAVVASGADQGRAEDVAARVLTALSEPFHAQDAVVMLTASVGLAVTDSLMTDAQTVVGRASVAMLAAKESGGNRFAWFAPELGADVVERAQLRHALTQAIHARAFELDYQPIIDMASGEVAGAEALVRWERDGRREAAGRFVPFAEESGLIVGIGRLVVARLQVDVPTLLDAMPAPFVLTFNLSVKELADDGIVDSLVLGPLRQHRDRLIVEVTESFEMHANTRAAVNLERLLQAGYRTAVDDFGTGFSNFTRLTELRPAIVKIDRSIVVRAGTGTPEGLATMQATTDIARALGSRVLAEGVESNDEAEAVMRMGIDLAQGYRYARPMGVGALIDFWAGRAVGAPSVTRGSGETLPA